MIPKYEGLWGASLRRSNQRRASVFRTHSAEDPKARQRKGRAPSPSRCSVKHETEAREANRLASPEGLSINADFNSSVEGRSKRGRQGRTHDSPSARPRLSVGDNLEQNPTVRERRFFLSSDNGHTS